MSKITKCSFRKLCLRKLKSFNKIQRLKKNKTICNKILNIIDVNKPKNILLYIPLDIEVDVRPIINKLRKNNNINVFVPYITGKSFKPVKYRLPLNKSKFNTKESGFSLYKNNKIDFDIIVVPIIGVDILNKRVGFGAGMYDRFYSTLNKKPIVIFTQITLCKTDEIITDEFDIKADYIIT